MAKINVKSFASPDERRPFVDKGHLDVVKFGDSVVGRGVFQPGWRWSSHVKPLAGTRTCEAAHCCYVVSGRMHLEMLDGEAADIAPGDFVTIAPGHDAWVVGDEACVLFDFAGFADYALDRSASRRAEGAAASPPG